jgi:magnesium-transporting ATPase (P-type)
VNDVLARHDTDVGLCVDTATDVAREAVDVVLLEKGSMSWRMVSSRGDASSPTPSTAYSWKRQANR